jgi:plastocyanin
MRLGSAFVVSAALALCACGGSGGGGGGGTCNPGATAAITIKSTGITPTAVCVLPSGTVSFNNTDTAAHTFTSADCAAELSNVAIPASASHTVTFGANQETCTFHDVAAPSNAAFQGTIGVTSVPAQGPGY